MTRTLLIATHNRGKVSEIAHMLADKAIAYLTLADLDIGEDVAETEPDFRGNAILKATYYASRSGHLTLADDSGLEVEALGGEPGVRTKRYGGPGLDDRGRYEYLLRQLAGFPPDQRQARFRCVMALADARGRLLGTAEGSCEGEIAHAAAGVGGFGYDPIFWLPDLGRTMAQLSPGEKNQLSHRGRALAAIAPLLRQAIASS